MRRCVCVYYNIIMNIILSTTPDCLLNPALADHLYFNSASVQPWWMNQVPSRVGNDRIQQHTKFCTFCLKTNPCAPSSENKLWYPVSCVISMSCWRDLIMNYFVFYNESQFTFYLKAICLHGGKVILKSLKVPSNGEGVDLVITIMP